MFVQQFYIIANILMIVDGLIVIVAGYAAYSVSLELERGMVMAWNDFLGSVLFMMFANNFVMGRFRLYSQTRFRSYLTMINSLILVTSIDILLLSTGAMLIGIRPFSRVFAIAYFLIALILFLISRAALHIYLDHRSLTVSNSRQILLVGTLERLKPVLDALRKQRTWGHQVIGCLKVDGRDKRQISAVRVLGYLEDFDSVLRAHQIDEVIFSLPRDFPVDLEVYLRKCEEVGVGFRIVPGLHEISSRGIRVEDLQGIPTLATYSGTASASGLLYKRILDLVAGLVGFVFFLLIYPVVGLAIKLDSPGPVLFKQIRVGRNNRQFYLYKFRSMVTDAESGKADLLTQSEMEGPIFKMGGDPRVTRVGRVLRRTSLDEVPQFMNVLKGEMSVVGTRPPTPDEVEQYEDWHRRRISMKPGITGLWQVSGRNKITDFNEIVRLDLEYIDQWLFRHDLVILLKTIWVVLTGRGAS